MHLQFGDLFGRIICNAHRLTSNFRVHFEHQVTSHAIVIVVFTKLQNFLDSTISSLDSKLSQKQLPSLIFRWRFMKRLSGARVSAAGSQINNQNLTATLDDLIKMKAVLNKQADDRLFFFKNSF